jgi:two-component system, cell cycle response regulator
VVNIVRADPALTGRLIHAANRVHAGMAKRTGVLREAVLRLGFSATRQIALGFSLVNDYRSGHCTAFDYSSYWSDSLLRGVSAQAVAARAGRFDPQEAFVCGLLADVGRLALATAQPVGYAELLMHGVRGADLLRAERERFGIDHIELSVALLENWCLPDTLVRTVRTFHAAVHRSADKGAGGSRRSWVMVLAEALAKSAATSALPAWKQVALDAAARLDFDSDVLNALVADTAREMSEWAPLLDLPVPDVAAIDYREYEHPCPAVADASGPLDILLLDDSHDDRDLVRFTLEAAGHQVHAVASGDEALAAIASRVPTLMITDWEMPDMDGIALCRALRATEVGKALYIIMYTGRSRDSELVEGIEAGADDFMLKPANPDVLLARVNAGAKSAQRTGGIALAFCEARLVAVDLAAAAGP